MGQKELKIGAWFSGGVGSARFTVWLNDFKGLFQPEILWFYEKDRAPMDQCDKTRGNVQSTDRESLLAHSDKQLFLTKFCTSLTISEESFVPISTVEI